MQIGSKCRINKINSSLGFPRIMYCYVIIQRISYKDFIMDIMDIETLEETKVDNRGNQHDGYLCSIVVNSREVFCVIDIYY